LNVDVEEVDGHHHHSLDLCSSRGSASTGSEARKFPRASRSDKSQPSAFNSLGIESKTPIFSILLASQLQRSILLLTYQYERRKRRRCGILAARQTRRTFRTSKHVPLVQAIYRGWRSGHLASGELSNLLILTIHDTVYSFRVRGKPLDCRREITCWPLPSRRVNFTIRNGEGTGTMT
jgi:hypothetical protein